MAALENQKVGSSASDDGLNVPASQVRSLQLVIEMKTSLRTFPCIASVGFAITVLWPFYFGGRDPNDGDRGAAGGVMLEQGSQSFLDNRVDIGVAPVRWNWHRNVRGAKAGYICPGDNAGSGHNGSILSDDEARYSEDDLLEVETGRIDGQKYTSGPVARIPSRIANYRPIDHDAQVRPDQGIASLDRVGPGPRGSFHGGNMLFKFWGNSSRRDINRVPILQGLAGSNGDVHSIAMEGTPTINAYCDLFRAPLSYDDCASCYGSKQDSRDEEFNYLRWTKGVRIWTENIEVEDIYFSDIDVSRDNKTWFHVLGHDCFFGYARLKLTVPK